MIRAESFAQCLEAHKAETARLERLTAFLGSFAPAIGETAGYEATIEAAPAIEAARDRAVLAAFKAVEAIARQDVPNPHPGA